ncbi:Uncharacterized protein GBIM_04541 [Gryllus bimaculatus]|nr:Uncharacterized protein GBIM_04541 [Gryllus bimaculatus]
MPPTCRCNERCSHHAALSPPSPVRSTPRTPPPLTATPSAPRHSAPPRPPSSDPLYRPTSVPALTPRASTPGPAPAPRRAARRSAALPPCHPASPPPAPPPAARCPSRARRRVEHVDCVNFSSGYTSIASYIVLHVLRASPSLAQVVRMLAAVVAVFAALWLPYRGMLVYNSFATLFQKDKFMDLWFLMFAKTCVYINR